MQWNVPADLEQLIQKRLSTGIYADAEEVLRSALEAQAVEDWTEEERLSISLRIDLGYEQAERGQLMDPDQARREIALMKQNWRSSKE